MASLLQALLSVNPLNHYLSKKKSGHKLVQEYIKIIKLLETETKLVFPIDFHKSVQNLALRRGNNEFTSYKQCDSHEFLIFFLDSLHEYLKKPVEIEIDGVSENAGDEIALEAMKSWKIFYEKGYSKIIEFFGGQYFSKVKRGNSPTTSNSFDPFTNLFLEIPIDCKNSVSIYDLFDNFTKPENLSDFDDGNVTTKEVCFWELPEFLIISLKRFTNNKQKITIKVDFPIESLDLRKYLQGYNEDDGLFDLVAVVNHMGGLNSGHYTAYCYRNENWLNFNDGQVTNLSRSSICSNNAYCLFYKKKCV